VFLESILASIRGGVIVLDCDLRVQVWNQRAEDMWGLRESEVRGQHFLNLDIGLPVEALKGSIRACIGGEKMLEEIVLQARNRRGRDMRCGVTCLPLRGRGQQVNGVILTLEERE
jgi:two-component system CheB/CheR fusion protein